MHRKRGVNVFPLSAEVAGGGVPGGYPGGGWGERVAVADGRHRGGRQYAGGAGYPGRLQKGAAVCGGVPHPPGAEDHHSAVWSGRQLAADPAGDCGTVRHQPLLCIPPPLL